MSAPDDELDELVHRADIDALVRFVDGVTASADWPRLLQTRDRCRAALATGRQLWPIATLAEYRLALWGDDASCATVVDDESSGRFTIGPLTEVAAQHHTAAALAAAGLSGPRLGYLAHERALRGEPIADDCPNPLDLPFEIQPWEPHYALATYSDDGLDAPAPAPSPARPALLEGFRADRSHPSTPERAADGEVEHAVRELLAPWTQSSSGRVEVVCVEGNAGDALTALGVAEQRLARISAADAMAWLAWAGASGGAHGRRRGAASGRFGAWWLVAAIGGLTDEWPCDPDELGELAGALRWSWWSDAHEPQLGWELRLVIEDVEEATTWAINAQDVG